MLENVDVTKDSLLTARTLLFDVYRSDGHPQRERMRSLKRIINLAKERGFTNEKALQETLQANPKHLTGLAEKPVKQLFEFVSPDEIILLSEPLLEP